MGRPSAGWFRRREAAEAHTQARAPSANGAQPALAPGPVPVTPAARVRRTRSSSPARPALRPLRADAPGRRGGRLQGTLPQWRNEADRQTALGDLERDAHAASTLDAMHAKLRTVARALAGWGLTPFPPSQSSVRALAATLKRGGYRSAPIVPLALQGRGTASRVRLGRHADPHPQGRHTQLRAWARSAHARATATFRQAGLAHR